jgi:hypothetical protein
MDPPRLVRPWVLLLLTLACRNPASEPATLATAVSHALAALPWDHATSVGAPLCPTLGPCDTIWLEPRITLLPHPAPAFFVPDARIALRVLDETPAIALPGLARLHRPVRYGAWSECLAHRHESAWPSLRRVCVALGVAGDSVGADTLHFALLVLTPAEGLKWPRVRLVRQAQGGWRGQLLSLGGE